MELKLQYPHIKKLGLKIFLKPYPHVPSSELVKALKKHGLSEKEFDKFFGVQTCLCIERGKYKGESGLYPHDIESVLERMETGKLTGTQLFWD